jgi:uncharacterized protein
MYSRLQKKHISQLLTNFPAVAVVGSRQVGKTTLAKEISSNYFDLETEQDRLRLDLEWDSAVSNIDPVILDEAQTWPAVFPRLRAAIDADRQRNGRFIVLGSVAPSLMREVSESLAGRIILVELSPLNLIEVGSERLNDLWLYGGYPGGGIQRADNFPVWQNSYLDLMVQRDLPNWGLEAKPAVTHRLVKMIAALHAQNWNASKIGSAMGLNYQTVQSYLEFLSGAFLVRLLQPFESNLKKRLVRSAKIYFRDSGLLHAVLGCTSYNALLNQPWVGFSWEGFAIEQIVSTLQLADERCVPYFLRTSNGDEIDLIFTLENQLWSIEIKLTTDPSAMHAKSLQRLAKEIGATRRIVVHKGTQDIGSEEDGYFSLPGLLNLINRSIGNNSD